jgi:hypothetical protein
MTDALLESLTRLYTEGDLEGARARLLHSAAWSQHQFTAYGDELVSQCWMSWLEVCGLSKCEDLRSVSTPGQSLHLFSLRPRRGREPVRISLWTWHNDEYLKRVFCHVDTAQLCRSLGTEALALAEHLPAPDPLLIEDYDPQEHVGIVDVVPGDLLEGDAGLNRTLGCWWALWQRMQLASVERCYAHEAVIRIPGIDGPVSPSDLTDYCSEWFVRMRRRCCQLESVIADRADPGAVAVLWRMEGDMDGRTGARRVRVPVVSLLQIADGRIRADTMIVDEVTLIRQLAS